MPRGIYKNKKNWNGTLEERFWRHVKKGKNNDCWEWRGTRSNGYGYTCIGTKNISAHRASYEIHYGKIPQGFLVCHSCDNPPCVNPKHLWLGTHKDNVQDMIRKGRGAQNLNRNMKMNKNIVEKIRKLYKIKINAIKELKEIKKSFCISSSCISDIVNKRTWK